MPHRIAPSTAGRMRITLIALPRGAKRSVLLAADLLMIPVCLWAAIALKYESFSVGLMLPPWLYLVATITSMFVFVRLGLYRAITRFVGFRIMLSVLSGAVAAAFVVYLIGR